MWTCKRCGAEYTTEYGLRVSHKCPKLQQKSETDRDQPRLARKDPRRSEPTRNEDADPS